MQSDGSDAGYDRPLRHRSRKPYTSSDAVSHWLVCGIIDDADTYYSRDSHQPPPFHPVASKLATDDYNAGHNGCRCSSALLAGGVCSRLCPFARALLAAAALNDGLLRRIDATGQDVADPKGVGVAAWLMVGELIVDGRN